MWLLDDWIGFCDHLKRLAEIKEMLMATEAMLASAWMKPARTSIATVSTSPLPARSETIAVKEPIYGT